MPEKSNLIDGMKLCKHCKGVGFVPMNGCPDSGYIKLCPLCKGKRCVDWITYAMGYAKKIYTPIQKINSGKSNKFNIRAKNPKVKRSKMNGDNNN